MKYINKLFLCALVIAMPMASCDTDELHDLNLNPQAVNQIDLNYLFSAAELGIASNGSSGDNRYIDWRTNIGMAAYAIQHLAQATGGIAPGDKYQENFETSAAPFEFTYNDQLKNISEIMRQTGPGGYAEGKHVNMRNAARILRAFSFHRLTDFYGAVPYSEANKGMEQIFFPKYDKQSAIYADLLKELDEASAALSASNPDEGFTKADFIYGGDIAKWKKWGYSLMLRLAMRVSNVDQNMAAQYVTKAAAGGVFTSNADNVWVKMAVGPSEWINQNGISRAFNPGDGGQPSYLSKTLVDFLKGNDPAIAADDDPRLMIISGGIGNWTATEWTPTTTDPLAQRGMPNGMDQGMLDAAEGKQVDQAQTFSRINPLMLQDDDPYMIMHHAEVEFLLAEALERGIGTGISGTAAEHYNAGVKSAMQMYTPFDASLTVSDAQVATYLATYPYGATPNKTSLQMIYEQLWVSKFFNWWEAWSDWRRTGYPQLTPTNYPGNITNGTIPVRLKYPTTEAAGNQNYSTGATLPDTYTTKVWWDGGTE
ncbi:SusD/RagB family nutrient-binding outer membrane lipoprotein [Rhodocytophaga aerolata]|uniref:SusD/RagB family nutrient-binding outer membrane lipoprotein n=1 Tax=Rhodocytophaga aerolata TaxID=455078 RepID=A0ABT8R085_9BACT|nr:SusD/RagB family nutrient-binding outer membrane lipoprotein [Rhodocytophaga aerolata]MDO1445076.1 SusD/RagB family nutrient-binding outer membrane lipoprotein [Rhodocytophaga aerolata]